MLRAFGRIIEVVQIQSYKHGVALARAEQKLDNRLEDIFREPLDDAAEREHMKTAKSYQAASGKVEKPAHRTVGGPAPPRQLRDVLTQAVIIRQLVKGPLPEFAIAFP